ncbi:MAG TPA: hypothetical protein VGM91_19340 [Conexibacter sp.]|jgi:hypothetical protein
MFGRQKHEALHDGRVDSWDDEAQTRGVGALVLLKGSESQLKKMGVLPKRERLTFRSVVAQTIESFIAPAAERTPGELEQVAHRLRDTGTVLAGSRIVDGPYGDLLLRASVAASGVAIHLHVHDTGHPPYAAPDDVTPPPLLLRFLNRLARTFAEAMAFDGPGSWPEIAYTDAVARLARLRPEACRALVADVSAVGQLKSAMYPPGWLSYAELYEMTSDESLSRLASEAIPC